MSTPLQRFQDSFFRIQEFQEAQRQFDEQAERARQQQMNQQLQLFLGLASQVRDPGELAGVTEFWVNQNPDFAGAAMNLLSSIEPSIAAMQRNLVADSLAAATPEEQALLGEAAAFAQMAGTDPFAAALAQSGAQLAPGDLETINLIQGGILPSWAQETQAELEGRRLDISEVQIAQTGEMDRLRIMASAGMMPEMILSDRQRNVDEIDEALQTEQDPQRRARLLKQRGDLVAAIERQVALMDAMGLEETAGKIPLNQMLTAINEAFGRVQTAETAAEKLEANRRYQEVTSMAARMYPGLIGTSGLSVEPRWGQNLPGRGPGIYYTEPPQDSVTATQDAVRSLFPGAVPPSYQVAPVTPLPGAPQIGTGGAMYPSGVDSIVGSRVYTGPTWLDLERFPSLIPQPTVGQRTVPDSLWPDWSR